MTRKITLYHAAPSRSSIVLWMLEELGQPFDIELISFKRGENRTPAFLAINPMGKLPTLRHGDTIITEAAAICTYLADEYPEAGLNIPVGDPDRGTYLKWLFFGPSCVEPAITEKAYPRVNQPARSTLGFGDFDSVVGVLSSAAKAADPWLLGHRFTAADVVIGSGLRWGMMFDLLPKQPEFMAYVERLNERPALKRANARDAKLQAEQDGKA
jgi:glutathione S-transferase